MEMERMKRLKDSLLNCVEGQINGHMNEVDTKELGEAVDMIKDFSEAIYYCTITKAMEEGDESDWGKKGGHGGIYYYSPKMMPRYPMEYMDPKYNYYPVEYMDPRYRENYTMPRYASGNSDNGGNSSNGSSSNSMGSANSNGSRYYHPLMDEYYPHERHPYEGKSPDRRKRYMEGKKNHHDSEKQMQELEEYMKELSSDITEMIQDATPEEKQLLQQKINTLATKIK